MAKKSAKSTASAPVKRKALSLKKDVVKDLSPRGARDVKGGKAFSSLICVEQMKTQTGERGFTG